MMPLSSPPGVARVSRCAVPVPRAAVFQFQAVRPFKVTTEQPKASTLKGKRQP